MWSRKDSLRWRVMVASLGAIAALASGTAAAAIPMPDPVARVPLVGLLPRWTWDPTSRPAPTTARDHSSAVDAGVTAARKFVIGLLTEQGESVASVSGYRLDDTQLVAVVAELVPRDRDGLRTTVALAFTVRVTPSGDGTYDTALVVEDR